jgi:hypothetical protein
VSNYAIKFFLNFLTDAYTRLANGVSVGVLEVLFAEYWLEEDRQMSVVVTFLLLCTITRHLKSDFLSFFGPLLCIICRYLLLVYFIAVSYVKSEIRIPLCIRIIISYNRCCSCIQ